MGPSNARVDGTHELIAAIRDAGPLEGDLAEMWKAGLHEAAQHLLASISSKVMPADYAKLLKAVFPLREGFTEADLECREQEVVRRIVSANVSPAVLVLGGSHDLSENPLEDWRLIRVEVNAWEEATTNIDSLPPRQGLEP